MIFSAVFLISAAVLSLQIAQTGIFSFALWHHLTYMAITVALLGLSAAGTLLALRKREFVKPRKILALSSIGFGFSLIFSHVCLSRLSLDAFMPDKILQIALLAFYYFLLVIPYFFAGFALSLTFKTFKQKINLCCFANLFGSAVGAFAILPVLEFFGAEGALFVIAAAVFLASILFSFAGREKALLSISLFLLISTAVSYPFKNEILPIKPANSKLLGYVLKIDPNLKPIYTKWDRIARVDLFDNENSLNLFNFFPGVKSKVLTIDGDAASFIYDFAGRENLLAESLYSSAYFIHEKPKTLILGLNFNDIAAALYHNSKSVAVVEVNRSVIEAADGKYLPFVSKYLDDPRVKIVFSEARNFIERDDEKYDVIQMSGVDTWSALSSGAYITAETYLYTSEAIKNYMERLNDDGTLAVFRILLRPPRETLKLSVEAVKILKDMGVKNPQNNIVVIGDKNFVSILIKKRSFTWTELEEINEITAKTKDVRILYAPGFSAKAEYYLPLFKDDVSAAQNMDSLINSFRSFFDSVEKNDESAFIAKYPYNIEAAGDDSPFFFNYFKFSSLGSQKNFSPQTPFDSVPTPIIILFGTLIQIVFFSVPLVVSPLFFMDKQQKSYGIGKQAVFFFMTGFGFMLIEIPVIQQFILFLGSPADAIAAATAVLLFFTAIGSLFSKKILIALGEKIIFGGLMIIFPLIILCYAILFPKLIPLFIGYSYGARLLLSTLFLAPLGFLLGQFFPNGLTIVGEKSPTFVPFAYSINGIGSVAASISAIILAMNYGFQFVFATAAFCYFFAAVAIDRILTKRS